MIPHNEIRHTVQSHTYLNSCFSLTYIKLYLFLISPTVFITSLSPQTLCTKCPLYLRECHDKVVKLGFLCSRDDLIHANFPQVVAVLDVLCYAAVKQDGLLGHNADLRAQEGHVDMSRVMAINQLQEAIDFPISRKQYNNQRAEIQSP